MEVVKELYDIEHVAPDDYTGPSKYEREFIIGPIANAGLSKMHAAMHTALHYHMGRGHHDRHCCAPNFDPGIRMRPRSLRDSLVYGTRKVRTKGLKVDESIRMLQIKYRSRSIRDSLVYGTRTKRCRHKHCTAWEHQHEWNNELEKWDVPMSMLKNEKRKTLWFEARQSVLDQEMIRRKSIPRNRYGELETDGGLYCGYYLREVVLRPWHNGGHTHDFYRYIRYIKPDDWVWEPDWYDPEPEKIEYHKRKVKELWEWHQRRNLIGDMRYIFARIAEARRQRRHFQRLKFRLKKQEMLWTELRRNSLWFNPWPEGDQQPEMIRRSLMTISKRLSTCAPMWNPMFLDFPTCEFYLNHLDELCPAVWDQFHYKCKFHKHVDLFERRETLLALIAAANAPPVDEDKIVLPPLCGPLIALEEYRKQWAEIQAPRLPPLVIEEVAEDAEIQNASKGGKKGKKTTAGEPGTASSKKGTTESKDNKKADGPKALEEAQGKKQELGVLKDAVKAVAGEVKASVAKRKKSVKIDPPQLPAQLTFLKKGKGRQSMAKPPPTEEELKSLERLNPPQEQPGDHVLEYVHFKFPIRKRRVRWSIQGGKVPLLPPPGMELLSKESQITALDILDLDKFEEKLMAVKPKGSEKKKGKDAAKDNKGTTKVDEKKVANKK